MVFFFFKASIRLQNVHELHLLNRLFSSGKGVYDFWCGNCLLKEVNLCVLRHSLSFLRCDRLAEKIRMCPEQDLKSRKGFLKALEVYVHRREQTDSCWGTPKPLFVLERDGSLPAGTCELQAPGLQMKVAAACSAHSSEICPGRLAGTLLLPHAPW